MTGQNLVEGLDWAVGEVATRIYYSSTTAATAQWQPGGSADTTAVATQ